MAQSLKNIPRAHVLGPAIGVLFMAFFGTMWAYVGIMGIQELESSWLLIVSITLGIVLSIGGCFLIFKSRKLPNHIPNIEAGYRKNIRSWFNVIFIAEGLAIMVAILVCNITDQTNLIPLLIAVIVGIHFFPLAYLFKMRIYYVTGILLCFLSFITWFIVPSNITIMEYQMSTHMSVVGFGSALILWGTGLVIWVMGKKLLEPQIE